MSLSRGEGSQYVPEGSDLCPELGHVSSVVQNHVGRRPAIFPTDLSGGSGLGCRVAVVVAGDQPLDLSFMINIHCHDEIEVLLLAGLDQQGNDMDHDGVGVGGALQLSRPGAYGGMHDPFEVFAGSRVSKDDLAEA